MPFKVEVGPPQIAIHNAQTVLITDPDGQVKLASEKGLYFLDTRLISGWMIYANGEPWDLLNGGSVTSSTASIHLTNRGLSSARTAPCLRAAWASSSGAGSAAACTRTSTSPITAAARSASTLRSTSSPTLPTCSK